MQGHKKLIPELKLNDNLRKLRGGVTPTPTPTPSADNVKFYKLSVTVEYNPYTKQYSEESSDPALYNQINADYLQYGDNALYVLNVNMTVSGVEPTKLVVFLNKQESQSIYYGVLGTSTDCCKCIISPEGFIVIFYIISDYDHTGVYIENGSLKVYSDIQDEDVYDDYAADYLINNIVSQYGADTKLVLSKDTEDGYCILNNVSNINLQNYNIYIISGYKGDKPVSLILCFDIQTREHSWYLNGGSVEWFIAQGDMNVYDASNNVISSSKFYKLLNLITTNDIQHIKFNLHVDIMANLTNYIKHPITFTEWSLQYNNNVNCMTSTVYVAALDKHVTIFIPIEDNPASYVYYQVV